MKFRNPFFVLFFAAGLVGAATLSVQAKSVPASSAPQPVSPAPVNLGPTAAVTYVKQVSLNGHVLLRANVSSTVSITPLFTGGASTTNFQQYAVLKKGNDLDFALVFRNSSFIYRVSFIRLINNDAATRITEQIPFTFPSTNPIYMNLKSVRMTLGEQNGVKVPVVSVLFHHAVYGPMIYLGIRTQQGWQTSLVYGGTGLPMFADSFDLKAENLNGNTTRIHFMFQKIDPAMPGSTHVFRSALTLGSITNPTLWSMGTPVNVSVPLHGQPLNGVGTRWVSAGLENMVFTSDTDVAHFMSLINGSWTAPAPIPMGPTSTRNVLEDIIEDTSVIPGVTVLTREQDVEMKLHLIINGNWGAGFSLAFANTGNSYTSGSIQSEYDTNSGPPLANIFLATVQEGNASLPLLEVHHLNSNLSQVNFFVVDTSMFFNGLSQVHVERMR